MHAYLPLHFKSFLVYIIVVYSILFVISFISAYLFIHSFIYSFIYQFYRNINFIFTFVIFVSPKIYNDFMCINVYLSVSVWLHTIHISVWMYQYVYLFICLVMLCC